MAGSVKELEIINRVKREYFSDYDWTKAVGDIDMTVCAQQLIGVPQTTYLWAEAKQGSRQDIYESFIQLILTIGKARIYEKEMPPYFLGAFDAEKIAFVDYSKVMHIFSKNDFNWNVTPSDHNSKEFKELYALLHDDLSKDVIFFKFAFDDKTLKSFINKNFKEGAKDVRKLSVGKNNFTFVYYDWVKTVKDTIAVDWKLMEKAGVLDCDFFLADLMSKDGMSIKEKLKVVLEKTKYKVLVKVEMGGMFGDAFQEFQFKDGQNAYNQFWNRYERPPKQVYQQYILDRRDLLVPQDIREIKGSYYTPEPWVRLSQEYLARVLGEDWQEEYYVWDCAAGSGNLLRGLTNKYNIYASTLDDSDVKVMHDAIDGGRLNLVKSNVFQFDFLNDGYEELRDGSLVGSLSTCKKIPESLRKIISDPEQRKKLVIYINPPYAEVSSKGEKGKKGVNKSVVHDKHIDVLGTAGRELYIQFLYRIDKEMPGARIAEFSKLKILQGAAFDAVRNTFNPRLEKMFCVPADTFDNVRGQFPIGFKIWNTSIREPFNRIMSDVFDRSGVKMAPKEFRLVGKKDVINKWIAPMAPKKSDMSRKIGFLCGTNGNSFQHNNIVYVLNDREQMANPRGIWITENNLMACCVYLAIRHCVESNWLNDRDQFLVPAPTWAGDLVFQVDCLVWSLFNNNIREQDGVCDWIPFYEDEVEAPGSFNSRFMADFLNGKVVRKPTAVSGNLFEQEAAEEAVKIKPVDALSDEARAVLDAGKEIWKYYLSKPGISVNASFLDIRGYFQGFQTTEKGKRKMNSSSTDVRYTELLANLRGLMKKLEKRIEPKIYEHGFLLR